MASLGEDAPKMSATERIRLKRLQKQGQAPDGPFPLPAGVASASPSMGVPPDNEAASTPLTADEHYTESHASQEYQEENHGVVKQSTEALIPEEVGSPLSPAMPDLAALKAQEDELQEQMAQSKQRLADEVAVKKEILSKTIQERFDQAVKETEILNMVRQELSKFDLVAQTDIDFLRIKIDETVKRLYAARGRYEKAEAEFMDAKMDLQVKKNSKTLLTEHLTLLIQQNEQRKAEKLEELMGRLAITTTNALGELKQVAEASAPLVPAAPAAPNGPAASPPPGAAAEPTAAAASTPLSIPATAVPGSATAAPATVDSTPAPATALATASPPANGVASPPSPATPATPDANGAPPAGKGKGKGPPPPGYRGPPGKGGPPMGKGGPPGKGGFPPGKGGFPPGKGGPGKGPPSAGSPPSGSQPDPHAV
jgi:hypothetical protein